MSIIVIDRLSFYLLKRFGGRYLTKTLYALDKPLTEFNTKIEAHNYQLARFLINSPLGILILLLVISAFIFFLTALKGWHDAEKQKHFLTLKHAQNKYILVRKYDTFIAVQIGENKMTNTLLLLDDINNVTFKAEYFSNLQRIEGCNIQK